MPSQIEQLSFFAVKVNNGSGCLFQPATEEYSYILTAQHVLTDWPNENHQITRFHNGVQQDIEPIDVIENGQQDIAILKIQFIGHADYRLSWSIPIINEMVSVFGFPEITQARNPPFLELQCKCGIEMVEGMRYLLESTSNLYSFNRDAASNVEGFSGSGIFYWDPVNGRVVLKGIFPRLNAPDGVFNQLDAHHMGAYDELIGSAGGDNFLPLIPSCLLSFEEYREKAFEDLDLDVIINFQDLIDQVLEEKSPLELVAVFKEKLFAPFNPNYGNNLGNDNLWKGWLEFFCFLGAARNTPELAAFVRNDKFLYVDDEQQSTWAKLIRVIREDRDIRRWIKDDDYVVYNSEYLPRTAISGSSARKIVQIDNARSAKGINISQHQRSASPGCFHIGLIVDQLDQVYRGAPENFSMDSIIEILTRIQNGQLAN